MAHAGRGTARPDHRPERPKTLTSGKASGTSWRASRVSTALWIPSARRRFAPGPSPRIDVAAPDRADRPVLCRLGPKVIMNRKLPDLGILGGLRHPAPQPLPSTWTAPALSHPPGSAPRGKLLQRPLRAAGGDGAADTRDLPIHRVVRGCDLGVFLREPASISPGRNQPRPAAHGCAPSAAVRRRPPGRSGPPTASSSPSWRAPRGRHEPVEDLQGLNPITRYAPLHVRHHLTPQNDPF